MNAPVPSGASDAAGRVIAIVGAGPGVGTAVARRFAAEGYAVGLIARNGERLTTMAAQLAQAGTRAATATADATDPADLRSALHRVAEELGHPSVLCFSPLPNIELIRPVLDTSPEAFMASLRLNVAGAAAAVEAVLPAMLRRGEGSLLFTTGSAAINQNPDRAASAVTTVAATAHISLLHKALAERGVGVGHTVIVGPIGVGPESHEPQDIAEDLWRHHLGTNEPRTVLRR